MKTALTLFFMALGGATSASACGYGNLYHYLKCDITSSVTYEGGYTETYGKTQLFMYENRLFTPVEFRFGAEAGSLEGRFTFVLAPPRNNTELKMQFSLPLRDVAQQISVPVKFPDGCHAEEPSVRLQTRYVADFGSRSEERDLTVSCTAITEFDED